MNLTNLPRELQLEIIIDSDNPYIAIAEPRLFDLVYTIMPRRLIRVLIEHDRVDLLGHITYEPGDFICALRSGAVEFIKSHTPSPLTYNEMLFYAAESGDIDLVVYVLENLIPEQFRNYAIELAIKGAARRGHLELVKYLVELGGKVSRDTIVAAGEHGDINLLEYLIETLKMVIPSETVRQLIIHGHYKSLVWLMNKGYPIDPEDRHDSDGLRYSFFDIAYGTGRENIIELVREYDELVSPREALKVAIETGNVAVIDELYDDYKVRVDPAIDKLETLKSLVSHGFKVGSSTLLSAIKAGRDNIVEWLLNHKTFNPRSITMALEEAIKAERPKIFNCIMQHTEPSNLIWVLDTLARYGSVYLMERVLQTIGAENANLKYLLAIAREKNNTVMVKYLESVILQGIIQSS